MKNRQRYLNSRAFIRACANWRFYLQLWRIRWYYDQMRMHYSEIIILRTALHTLDLMIKVISLVINFHARTLRQIESLQQASRLDLPLQGLQLIQFLANIAKYANASVMVKWIILLGAVSHIAVSRLTDNVTMPRLSNYVYSMQWLRIVKC